MKKAAPQLKDIPKGNPWKVPADYFDTLSERISDKVHGEKSPEVAGRFLPGLRPLYVFASVAAVLLIVAGVYFFVNNYREGRSLTSDEILVNIEENIYYYSEETIIEALFVKSTERGPNGEITPGEVVDYLIYEDISDIELLNDI
ncbi:MAG: hypothetical protein JXB00_00180 [Bacteroidales bacterium]|nr:hypothetical protein [Bacteroidales bacterium]